MKLLRSYLPFASVISASLGSELRAALYTMSDEPTGNYIIGHEVQKDGTLKLGKITYAGGDGYTAFTSPSGLFVDLFGAGSIIVSGDNVFAVNPGSNTLAMFEIDHSDPTKLTMIGKPVDTGGDFPMSVDISPTTGNACVLNTGIRNGIQCYTVDQRRGLKLIPGSSRTTNIMQFNSPPLGPDNTASHILFSKDGKRLTIAVKGFKAEKIPGYLASWEVAHDGSLSQDCVLVNPPTTPAPGSFDPFGMTNVPGQDLILSTDPGPHQNGPGFVLYDFRRSLNATTLASVIPGQADSCWVMFSPRTGSAYSSDRTTNQISESRLLSNLSTTTIAQYQLPAFSALLDIGIVSLPQNQHDYFYVLAGNTTTIHTFRLDGPGKATLIQGFNVSQARVPIHAANIGGMATWPRPSTL